VVVYALFTRNTVNLMPFCRATAYRGRPRASMQRRIARSSARPASKRATSGPAMDIVFLLLVAALAAVTFALIFALERLRSCK